MTAFSKQLPLLITLFLFPYFILQAIACEADTFCCGANYYCLSSKLCVDGSGDFVDVQRLGISELATGQNGGGNGRVVKLNGSLIVLKTVG
jgi:hypothetical protein